MNDSIEGDTESTRSRILTSAATPLVILQTATATASGPTAVHSSTGGRVFTKNITANIIADLIVGFCSEHGDLVTNLRLQKLLFFAQAWHLALRDKPLFPERFQAWVRGPVQPNVYARFHHFGSSPIEGTSSAWNVPKGVERHIADVMEAYGSFSSYELELIACDDEPWREARRGIPSDEPSANVIDEATMKRFYQARHAESKK